MKLIQSLRKSYRRISSYLRLNYYRIRGYRPWTTGYTVFRNRLIQQTICDPAMLERFKNFSQLPEGFGVRLDERVIEYPWVLSKLSDESELLLDAGSVLDFQFLLEHPRLASKRIVTYTLAPEGVVETPLVSYIYGDLRETILRSELFDTIVCISTLEHVGMNNGLLYTQDILYDESKPVDYRLVVKEFHRLLKPDGRLLLTVPYGRYEDHGWLQQFDNSLLQDVLNTFGGRALVYFYIYSVHGWNVATREQCDNASYHDIHQTEEMQDDFAAAARAVACVTLYKVS